MERTACSCFTWKWQIYLENRNHDQRDATGTEAWTGQVSIVYNQGEKPINAKHCFILFWLRDSESATLKPSLQCIHASVHWPFINEQTFELNELFRGNLVDTGYSLVILNSFFFLSPKGVQTFALKRSRL